MEDIMPVEHDNDIEDVFDDVAAPPTLVDVGTTSSGPEASSTAPPHFEEPHPVTDAAENEPEAIEDAEPKVPEFDPRVRMDFEGLLFLGYLTDTFHWAGHSFTIRTLTVDEIMEVGLLHAKYARTIADSKAYQRAVTAACLVQVDGKDLPQPISDRPSDTALQNRWEYVGAFFPITLDAIYDRYLVLEGRVSEVLTAMGKA
jgi:hypothetical protein